MRLVVCLALLCLVGVACAEDADKAPPPVLSKADAQAAIGAFRAMLTGSSAEPLPQEQLQQQEEVPAKPEEPVFSETDATAVRTRFRQMMSGSLQPLLDDKTVDQFKRAGKLDLKDIPDEATTAKMQKERELQIAADAASKQAAFDAWKFQQAMRFREMQRRRRHHMRRQKLRMKKKKGMKQSTAQDAKNMRFRQKRTHHKRHHHTHHFHPNTAQYGSFMQQYYGHPRFAQILKEDEEDEEEEEDEDAKAEKDKEDEAEKSRFQQMQAKAKARAQAEQQMWHTIEYGNSMGGGAPGGNAVAAGAGYVEQMPGVNRDSEPAPQAGNAYGMPMAKDPVFAKVNQNLNFGDRPSFLQPPSVIHHTAPVAGMRFQELHAGVTSHHALMEQQKGMPMEQLTTSMFQAKEKEQGQQQQQQQTGSSMRFQEVRASTGNANANANANPPQGESQIGNPNPGGVPMPFYPPSQAPPPAPNQMPAPAAMQAGMYPQNLVVAPSIGGGLANAGTMGAQAEASRFMANNPRADVNQYPFNSFLETDAEIIHPTVYHMAYHPSRDLIRTPLTAEHMAEFPLLK